MADLTFAADALSSVVMIIYACAAMRLAAGVLAREVDVEFYWRRDDRDRD